MLPARVEGITRDDCVILFIRVFEPLYMFYYSSILRPAVLLSTLQISHHISLLFTPTTVLGVPGPSKGGSSGAYSKAATTNSTVSLNSLSMTECTRAFGNGSSKANKQGGAPSKSTLTRTQHRRCLVGESILHNSLPVSGFFNTIDSVYTHNHSYNAHCYDLHHHGYLIFDFRLFPMLLPVMLLFRAGQC